MRAISTCAVGALIAVGLSVAWQNWPPVAVHAQSPVPLQLLGDMEANCKSVPDLRFVPAGDANPIVWSDSISRPGARFLMLHISVTTVGVSPWALNVDAPDQHFALKSSDVTRTPFGIWTDELRGDLVRLSVSGAPGGASIGVDRCVIGHDKPHIQSLGPHDNRQPISDFQGEPIYEWGQSVTLLKFATARQYYTCAGVLITPVDVLTAGHCVPPTWDKITVVFHYEEASAVPATELGAVSARVPDKSVDYGIVTLPQPAQFPTRPFVAGATAPPLSTPIILIQHADGLPTQVVKTACGVALPHQPRLFGHTCSTMSGSSGSPLFDYNGNIVGLHEKGSNEGDPTSHNIAVNSVLIAGSIKKFASDVASRTEPPVVGASTHEVGVIR
jgi:V8-like Glu-specific endopeptidase